MSRKKERPITKKDEEIELKEDLITDIKITEKNGKKVRAIANAVFKEYEPVEEQDPGPDH